MFAVVAAVLLGSGLLEVRRPHLPSRGTEGPPISYADAFALASAMEQSADLITGDPEFKMVEHLVNVIQV